MNRRGNVLNGSLLGSSGRSSRVFLKAVQVCDVTIASVLHAGRGLRALAVSSAASSPTLRAGRKLKSSLLPAVVSTARLYGLVAVSLKASVAVTAVLSTVLHSCKVKYLQGTAVVTAAVSAALQKHTPKTLIGNLLVVSSTQSVLTKGVRMYGECIVQTNIVGELTESSRAPAPMSRTARVPFYNRVSVVSRIK